MAQLHKTTFTKNLIEDYFSKSGEEKIRYGVVICLDNEKEKRKRVADAIGCLIKRVGELLYINGAEAIKDLKLFHQKDDFAFELDISVEVDYEGQEKSLGRLLCFIESKLAQLHQEVESQNYTIKSKTKALKGLALGTKEFVMCRTCDGSGEVKSYGDDEYTECWYCEGIGKVVEDKTLTEG